MASQTAGEEISAWFNRTSIWASSPLHGAIRPPMKEQHSPPSPSDQPPKVIGYATPESSRRLRRPVPAARWLRFWRCHPVDVGVAWVVVSILLCVVDAGLQSGESYSPRYLGN